MPTESAILRDFDRGLSYTEIGQKHGLHRTSVGRIVRRHRQPRPRGAPKPIDRHQVIELYTRRPDLSIEDIADRVGCHFTSIHRIVNEEGCAKRRGS